MKRRSLVALVSAITLLVMALVVVTTGVVVTQTGFGQEQIRRVVETQLRGVVHGSLTVGRISGSWLTGVNIDTLAIRDEHDSLLVSTGRISVQYDPRDLFDKRVWLRRVDVAHPIVRLRSYEDAGWNFQRIFPSKNGPERRTPGRSFGDFVVLDSVHVHDGSFTLVMPWHPADSLRGARRDSVIRAELGRNDHEIRRSTEDPKSSFAETWRWTGANVSLSRIRIADPDSNKFGKEFRVDSLRVVESNPPFSFRKLRGDVRILGDSLWLDVPHFELPASAGSAAGKIWWGSDKPVRLDVAVHTDSVSLKDVAWVYPTLPTTGGGKVELHIGNDARDLHVLTYKLANMDVRTTGSRLVGTMTFAVGGPVLAVRDLDLRADPVDWDLIRAFNGKPFPEDWRGQLIGTVKGKGGPLNHFVIDDAQATWRDGHIPGAYSAFRGKGELDILDPAFTQFHHFAVDVSRLELRSIEKLFPLFPRLRGTIEGKAVLDSSWLDVRFSDADVTHRDEDAEPSRFTGSGRVTVGNIMVYDVDAQALPVSLTTLARSYPMMPLKGSFTGPVKLKGTMDDLAVDATLEGEAGKIHYVGTIDADSLGGYGAHGAGDFAALDLSKLISKEGTVPTSLTGEFTAAMTGDSLANLAGAASLALQKSTIQGHTLTSANGRLRFEGQKLIVDTAKVVSTVAVAEASGALGLPHGPSDSLHLDVTVDSLGGLRKWIMPPPPAGTKVKPGADSLAGTLGFTALLRGRLDSLDASGIAKGARLVYGTTAITTAGGEFDIRNTLAAPTGTARIRLDTIALGTLDVDSAAAEVRLAGKTRSAFAIGIWADEQSSGSFKGQLQTDSATTRLALTDAELQVDTSRWTLRGPATLVSSPTGIAVDSIVLRNDHGGRIDVRGSVPTAAPVIAEVTGDSVPLGDLGTLLQMAEPLGGTGSFEVQLAGTRAKPEIGLNGSVNDFEFGTVHVEQLRADGTYRAQRLTGSLDMLRQGKTAFRASASLPMNISLFRGELLENDSLFAEVRADSADFAIMEAFIPQLRQGTGRLDANFAVGGTWARPTFGGDLRVTNGEVAVESLNIRLKGITADISARPGTDSLVIRQLSAWSGASPRDSISLVGYVAAANRDMPYADLKLRARNFHVVDKKTLARLDISTTGVDGVHLVGRLPLTKAVRADAGATVGGTLVIDRGTIFLPERQRKQVLAVEDIGSGRGDTTFIPSAQSTLAERLRLEGVRIALGDEVWLRSREANVKLGGSLAVTGAPDRTHKTTDAQGNETVPYRLALEGTLSADRGTYTLDFGLVKRDFKVQKGAITFQGTADNNPYVDITALHEVKRAGQPDLGVLVLINGPLNPYPTIQFQSDESYAISQSDLVSYLVTGRPSFENSQDVMQTVVAAILPSVSSIASSGLRSLLGSGVDVITLQGGATDANALQNSKGFGQSSKDFIFGARLGAEKQLTNNVFVSVSAGLCSFRNTSSTSNSWFNDPTAAFNGFWNALAWKLDYRFNPLTSVQAGIEPAANDVYCSSGVTGRTLVSTPKQLGLSFFRTWRF